MILKKKNYELKENLFYNVNSNTHSKKLKKKYQTQTFYKITDSKATILNLQNSNSIIYKVKKKIGYSKNVLEVGCDNGQISFFFSIGTNNKIFGLDTNFDSLKIANNFAKENNFLNVKFINADIQEDIFNEGVFDFIWCNEYLHHKENPMGSLNILSKSLKKGGYILLGMHDKFSKIKTDIKKYIFKVFENNSKNQINSRIFNSNLHHYESYTQINEILNWIEINGIEFINSGTSSNFINDENFDNLFKKKAKVSYFSIIANQISSIFHHNKNENNLFFLIGRKL